MRVGDDAIIAEIALKRGWIDRERLRRAVELQWAAAAAEVEARLLDVLVAKGFLAEAQAREIDAQVTLRALAEHDRSRTVPGYGITRSLGQDGLGGAFSAVQLSMDRPVVLKVLSPDLAKDPSFLERFLRESKAVGRISHPNVVSGLDTGRSGELCYYAVDFAEGQDLRQVLRGGPMPIVRVVDIGEQMVRALIHAAELSLVHRDIQPRQIVVTAEGTARLCGLGQTRFPTDPSVVDTGIPVGSPFYLSPELAAGSRAVDIRSDVYSLGATLYHLATGQPPLKAATMPELLRKHIDEVPRAAVELRREMPGGLSDLLARMLAKRPADRCSSLDSLLRAVQRIGPEPERVADAPAALPTIAAPRPEPPQPPEIASPPEAADTGGPLPTIAPPAAPAAPGGRLLNALLWTGIFAALIGGLVVAVFWALRARSIWPKPRPKAVAVEESPVPAAPAKAAGEPRPKHPEPAADELARHLKEAALGFDQENLNAYGPVLLHLRRAWLAAGDGAPRGGFEERLRARGEELTAAGQRAFQELNEKVKTFRARDQFGEALRAAAAFPQGLLVGRWAERFFGPAVNLQTQAEQRYLELAATAASALQRGETAEGLRCYEGIGALGIPWISRVGADLLLAAKAYTEAEQQRLGEAAKLRSALQRRQGFGQLGNSFGAVQDEMKNRQYAKALELCQGIPPTLRKGEPGEAVAQLEARIRVLGELWEAVSAGPPAAIGQSFTLYGQRGQIVGFKDAPENCQLVVRVTTGDTEGKVHRQPIRALQPAQIAQLAEWALARQPAAERALKIALLYWADGKSQEAAEKLDEAQKLGGDVTPYRQDLAAEEAIAKGRAAHQQAQWAQARTFLETALNQYGATFPVIVQHRALTQSLAQCLNKLGVSASPPPSAPLPVTLRRLVLLPSCRLIAGRPLNPAAAYLASPSERVSPAIVGPDTWGDYTLTLRWTVEAAQGSRLALLFRLTESQPGQFSYYYVAADRDRLVLGRREADRGDELAVRRHPELLRPGDHQLVLTAAGSGLSVALDGGDPLQTNDDSASQGHIGLATSDARLLVGELAVLLPATWPRAETKSPRP